MSDGSSSRPIAYVADAIAPEAPPPALSVGPIHWARENLFSSPLNAGLTVISIMVLALGLPPLIDWAILKSVWNASSLQECRQIIAAEFGEGQSGACWAIINERFDQLIYGFYPPELRWRPNVAGLLLIAALAPVLFASIRPLAWIMGAIAVVIALDGLLRDGAGVFMRPSLIAAAAIAVMVWVFGDERHRGRWLILSAAFPVLAYFLLWGGLGFEPVTSNRFGGFLLTLVIGVTGIVASLPIGILLALGRRSDMIFIRSLSVMFIEFIRGVPLITLLFVASTLLNYFLPPGTSFDLILRVLIMVALFASAYMAEVIRGGLAALPKGQYEAADAMGLTYWQSMRLIILPQALKISIPGIVNTFIGLFKDTTLVAIIGLLDPLGIAKPIRADSAWTGVIWELYGFIGFVFFLFCFGMSRYSQFLERKLRAGDRR